MIVCGEVSEWLMVPLSKSGRLKGLAGSNPALSAEEALSHQLSAVSFRRQMHRVTECGLSRQADR